MTADLTTVGDACQAEYDRVVPVLAVVEPAGLRLRIADGTGGLFDCIVPDKACRVVWVGKAIHEEQLAEVLDALLSDEDRCFLDLVGGVGRKPGKRALLSDEDRCFLDGVVSAAVANWIQREAM